MVGRRDFLKGSAGVAGYSFALSQPAVAQTKQWLRYLCPPDDRARELDNQPPSPPAEPFVQPLFAPPDMVPASTFENGEWSEPIDPPPVPEAHQRYNDFHPAEFYKIHEVQTRWQFHPDGPYNKDAHGGSWVWGYHDGTSDPANASSPGPTYRAKYGKPILLRRYNDLPTIGYGSDSDTGAAESPYNKLFFALPSTTSHLHNGHTASESDGNPQDWIDSGEFWDHQYGNFPSAMDPREKLTTLWYHDHRLDFTAANVYSGLFGFYLLYDPVDPDDPEVGDTGDEETGWRLPSRPTAEGPYKYDVPLVMQDIRFRVDEHGAAQMVFDNWNTDGMLGDHITVNRKISPYFEVEQRKYRFRILNGGPSRFYQLFLRDDQKRSGEEFIPFVVITGDGNMLPEPVQAESIFFSVAQRVDVIIDFSEYKEGDTLTIFNLLKQTHGMGPSTGPAGPHQTPGDPQTNVIQFRVTGPPEQEDKSQIPDTLRPLPTIDLTEVKRQRSWGFGYDGGLWTINGKIMDPNRIDAGIEQGSAEIWTFINSGNDWSHPIHSHFTEFLIMEINGQPFRPRYIQSISNYNMTLIDYHALPGTWRDRPPVKVYMGGPRRDVATLLPGNTVKLFMRWHDFLGKHVMHCHNVVHEDHAMMVRWDIMEPGSGFDEPRSVAQVYGGNPPPWPDPRPPAPVHLEMRPANPNQVPGGAKSGN